MSALNSELWSRIAQFSFDEGDETLTFAKRLARENAWSEHYAQRAIEEYRRFMYLAVSAGHSVTPSDQVDQVWHLHLTYTHSYWDRWCGNTLGKPIHHGPTKGGKAETTKFVEWYERTKSSYVDAFTQEPPSDIWPSAEIRFGWDVQFRRVNIKRNWVIPKPTAVTYGPVSLPAFAICVIPLLATNSGVALTIIAILIMLIVGFVFSLMSSGGRGRRRRRGDGDSTVYVWDDYDNGDNSSSEDSGCGGGGCGGGD